MPMRALRGAITVAENSRGAILRATDELLAALEESNELAATDVISAVFSVTEDLDAAYPAEAARARGWTEAGLMCLQEMNAAEGLPRCVRVLVTLESDRAQGELVHCYLGGASRLRPDWG